MKKLLLFVLTAFVTAMNAQAQDCPRIFTKGDTLYTDPAPQYQWFRDQNPIPGATNQWHLPTKGGNFAVQVSGTATEFSYALPPVDKTISGRIIDERYEPIADAVVSFGINNVKSDAQGRFSLTGLSGELSTAVVTITKDGFWKNTQRVHFFDQVTAPLTAMLEPLKITNRFDAQKGATISERGFFLTFPPNSAVTESGQVYTGTINISLKRSFPAEDGFGLRMPGGDFSAIDANGQEKMLVSYGFMSAEIQGSTGEKLKLAPDTEATLEFYIPWEQNKTAPDSMPLWHFDETAGTWRPEGTARKMGPRYVGTVKHFSSWNLDVPRGRATVKGKTRNCKGTLIPNVVINVGQRTVTTNSNGEYTSYVPSDTEFDVTAKVDTVSVTPLVENEEREVKDLENASSIGAVGVVDTFGTIKVYGYGVVSYSVDGGRRFQSNTLALKVGFDKELRGFVTDSADCRFKFPIYYQTKLNDCQVPDSATLANATQHSSFKSALADGNTVYKLGITGSQTNPKVLSDFFPCLRSLTVSNFKSDPSQLCSRLFNLETLTFYNSILGKIPNTISLLPQLERIVIKNDSIVIPKDALVLPKSVISIYFEECKIDSLPDNFGELSNLGGLWLMGNKLTSLPGSFQRLKNLKLLDLGRNNITEIPDSLFTLTQLFGLSFESNLLTEIPEKIGLLTELDQLFLSAKNDSSNTAQLKSLPESIGNLKKLRILRLEYNQLTHLPPSIANLKDCLRVLYLHGNLFSEQEKAKIRWWLPKTDIKF